MQEWVEHLLEVQGDMGYIHPMKDPDERWQYFKDQAFSLIVECVETVQETPWKPWKPAADQPLEKVKAAYEICDMLVFTINMWNTLNPPIRIEDAMEHTIQKIRNRIDNQNYGKQE